MKILIVDDEPRHRRGMKNMILSLRSSDCVIDASDGQAALALIREERPDVVLTDIRMPNLDGLELLGLLEHEAFKPKVVMVSAYDLFEYAQAAMRHGAYDYLLKPIDRDKVAELLRRVQAALQEETLPHSESETLKLQLRAAASAYRKRLLLSWISGGDVKEAERQELTELEWLHGSGAVIYSELQPHADSGLDYDASALMADMERVWAQYGAACTLPLDSPSGVSGQWISLVRLEPQTLEASWERLRTDMLSLNEAWSLTGRLWHCAGEAPRSLWEEGERACRQARAASVYHFYERHKGALTAEDATSVPSPSAPIDSEALFEALQDRSAGTAVDLCARSFERFAAAGRTAPSSLKEQAALLLMKIKSRNREHVDRQVGSALMQAAVTGVSACRTFGELLTLMESRLRELHQALHAGKEAGDKEIAAECVKWIADNRQKPITLEQTAEHFFFNPSYFSTWIKNHTGKTFTEHLLEARMERAAQLLADNRLKIYEIAAESGYTDTKYFCRVFKKHFGLSPERHRQMSLLQQRGGLS
ncbi:response regulator [Cohnella sp. LGH]|uniref:response regulator transcription factor n=1 Tax=Cohnella sp. LGH TaxID=1619153 RepID=UPI001ADAF399|nr:response regulator [Cohnella sp. LGH]QTH43106.1 response regulator [Cohnella sp. LGH]